MAMTLQRNRIYRAARRALSAGARHWSELLSGPAPTRGQLDSIYAHMASASVISTLFALALVIYLTPEFGTGPAHTWFALKAGVASLRFVMTQAYRANWLRSRQALANRLMLGSLAVDGAIWGLACVWGANERSDVVSLLVACLVSVAMLATLGLQVRLQAAAAFVVPMLVPVVVALAWRGDTLGLLQSGGCTLVLIQVLLTGYASEKRLMHERSLHERTELALEERSQALQVASAAKTELQAALDQASKTAAELELALDQVRRQSAVKSLFLGTINHELRTPLHGILGLAELAQREVTHPVTAHRLELIRNSGAHLLELIGALLDISRIESGHLELHQVPFDLAGEMRNLVDLYEVRCHGKGIAFAHVLDMGPSCWVSGDAARVRQVLHNLLGNAVKFTDRGQVSLKVTRSDDVCTFEVTDTGRGISASALPKIFEAFHQVGGAASSPNDGTGLGLTIARELAQAMGGTIEASSVKDEGSRFVFTARMPGVDPSGVPVPSADCEVSKPQLPTGYRVLLVEDNPVNCLIAQAHLEEIGATVTVVGDGSEAVHAALASPRPHLVLMDCRMPLMDGPTATRQIRGHERSQGLDEVPIIAVTAMPSEDDRRECSEAGMNGFLSKPFTQEALWRAIGGVIRLEMKPADRALLEFAESLGDLEPDFLVAAALH